MNKSKHLDVQFVNEQNAAKLVNNPKFVSLEEHFDDCYEVSHGLKPFYIPIGYTPFNIYDK